MRNNCQNKLPPLSQPKCPIPLRVKNGKKPNGQQNFLCKKCKKQFLHEYFYVGSNPMTKYELLCLLMRGNGIRDCSVILKVSFRYILNFILKQADSAMIKPKQKHYQRVIIDEMYSFVQNKGKKCWIFYVYAPETKEILAYTMGKRTKKQLQYLMLKVKELKITIDWYCTDGLKSFVEVLPYYQHLIGKKFTQAIEGTNNLIRQRLHILHRRTAGFSKKLRFQYSIFKIFIFNLNNKSYFL